MSPAGHKSAYRIRRSVALLALFALAGVQLVSATHAFSHDELILTDVCGVCLQLEQLDEALVAHDAVGTDASPQSVEPFPGSGRLIAGSVRRYAARAPPTV